MANSLLLSTFYHLLRVIPVSSAWLSEIKRIIRQYVLPFFPAPSWTALTSPRKHGGVGLADLADQSHAFHLIYIQRLLKPIAKHDYISPWIVYSFQIYTGHASILPWLMFPQTYKPMLTYCLSMLHLTKLLCSQSCK